MDDQKIFSYHRGCGFVSFKMQQSVAYAIFASGLKVEGNVFMFLVDWRVNPGDETHELFLLIFFWSPCRYRRYKGAPFDTYSIFVKYVLCFQKEINCACQRGVIFEKGVHKTNLH